MPEIVTSPQLLLLTAVLAYLLGSIPFGLVITRALGDLLGHDLVSSKAAVAHGRLVQHLAGLARESGDVLSGISDALADGELTPNELSRIENDLADLDAQVQAARATVRAKLMTLRGEA